MQIQFNINYRTFFGQTLYVCGNTPELGKWDVLKAVALTLKEGERWEAAVEIADKSLTKGLEYKYFIRDTRYGSDEWEWGKNRVLQLPAVTVANVRDAWRSAQSAENALQSSAFTQALMRRQPKALPATPHATEGTLLRFQLLAPRVDAAHTFAIVGSDPALGAWDETKAIVMDDSQYPLFTAQVALAHSEKTITYKYCIYDTVTQKAVTWDEGDNRTADIRGVFSAAAPAAEAVKKPSRSKKAAEVAEPTPAALAPQVFTPNPLTVISDDDFRYPVGAWKGAGVAIPVFALRSHQGTGVGEFSDLKLLVDWCKKTGMKMIQVLPVNDTVATQSWTDSYPYAAISVFALHPMYVNLQKMGTLADAEAQAHADKRREELNALPDNDYEATMRVKSIFFKKMYDQERPKLAKNKAFQSFIKENADWLKPYAAFSYLRDLYQTPDFSQWAQLSVFDREALETFCDAKAEHFEHIEVHYFIQYHAHLQLLEAANYAREHGVVIKGDIPIGIYRYSVDAWIAPNLYNMSGQAGAPPDDFAIAGQNWGFPTYNWEEMAKDGYAWWKSRLQTMAKYFDAFRIDHILGFFRIWEIPYDQVEGLLGKFNPAIPFNIGEMQERGIWFDRDRLTQPYIREHFLAERFQDLTDEARFNYLDEYYPGCYTLKAHVRTQRQVENHIAERIAAGESAERMNRLKFGLFGLINEVLLLEHPFSNGEAWHPRISLHQTQSYRDLDAGQRTAFNALHDEYFFRRQEDFWRAQAMQKLPALVHATDMLICGEDLGMIPKCVPGVMRELGLLSLEIQRMPKGDTQFGHPADAPYLSVVTPSCHDMSTVRGWWEEDRAKTQQFYNQILGHWGGAPYFCEPYLVKEIVVQHLYSPAMWAVFPIQDLVGMDNLLRRSETQAEQINVPANPKHYWRYRFHLPLEELLKEEDFNNLVLQLLAQSGRNSGY